jgi:translation initiation factor 1
MKKSKKHQTDGGIVYSTNPDTMASLFEKLLPADVAPKEQTLKVKLDTKMIAGKKATIVTGFTGSTAGLEALAKKIKTQCGTGGSVKDDFIIIQGDFVDKVKKVLSGAGYKVV